MRWHFEGRTLVVHSPAKLNLFLEVLGKRPDGFHDLETVMVRVNWYDTLRFTDSSNVGRPSRSSTGQPEFCGNSSYSLTEAENCRIQFLVRNAVSPRSEGLGKSVRGDEGALQVNRGPVNFPAVTAIPTGRENLVVRAALLLQERSGRPIDVTIELLKRIPAGSGLGGGSGNAAAALWALNHLLKIGMPNERLLDLAAELGSDVPFFFSPGSGTLCRGRGEKMQPIGLPAGLSFVVARPQSGLSTAEVFRHCLPTADPQSVTPLVRELTQGRMERIRRLLRNALQEPAEILNSELRFLKEQFNRLPVIAHQMSGSGTAWFGFCRNQQAARSAAQTLRIAGVPHVQAVQSCC